MSQCSEIVIWLFLDQHLLDGKRCFVMSINVVSYLLDYEIQHFMRIIGCKVYNPGILMHVHTSFLSSML